MKLRMYFRGLGIGIAVTALVLSLTGRKAELTDQEIVERAKSLGMVSSDSVLKLPETKQGSSGSEPEATMDAAPKEAVPTNAVKAPEEESAQEAEDVSAETSKPQPVIIEEEQEPLAEPDKSSKNTVEKQNEIRNEDTYILEIANGSSSDTVCRLLEKGGLVSSAAEFDNYLCNHGYDHKIRAGIFQIPVGADYDTIAKLITTKP